MLPDQPNKILFLSDLHAPSHHLPSLNEVRLRAAAWMPDLIVFGGDMLDAYGLSSYSQNPAAPDLQAELDACATLLKPFTAIAPTVYLWGNHEQRLIRTLYKTPALSQLRNLDLQCLLENAGLTVDLLTHRYDVDDHLILIHGRLYGVTAARQMALRCPGKTIVQGHSHRISSYVVENFGIVGRCYTTGWLGDQAKIGYDAGRFSQWCRGWTEIERDAKWWHVAQKISTHTSASEIAHTCQHHPE